MSFNTALIENWSIRDNKLRGYCYSHMLPSGTSGNWMGQNEMFFTINSKLYGDKDFYKKDDVVKTNSSILVLGNPRV